MQRLRPAKTQAAAILAHCRTVAVVGLVAQTPPRQLRGCALHAGPRLAHRAHQPQCDRILGETAYPSLTEAARHHAIDLVNVFRNSEDVPPLDSEAIAIGAKALWLQMGIAHAGAAAEARAAGLWVVQDQCLMVEHAQAGVRVDPAQRGAKRVRLLRWRKASVGLNCDNRGMHTTPPFDTLHNPTFLQACMRQATPHTPVWLMRQAGRYLPEYVATRAKAGSFMGLATNRDYATEVTLQPLERYPLDAAILFSDILTVPDAMGLGLLVCARRRPAFCQPHQDRSRRGQAGSARHGQAAVRV